MPAKIKLTTEELLQWRDLYERDGFSIADIATKAGVAKNTVRDRLISLGVKFDKVARITRKAIGRPSARRGAKLTQEHREAIRARFLGNKWSVGRIASDETRAKMRAAAKKRRSRGKKIGPRIWSDAAIKAENKRQKFKRVLKSLLRAAKLRKREKTAEALGYSRDILVRHIASQFSDGMSWNDRTSFSIDHIIPIAEFVRRGVTDPKIVCSLANLRPLPVRENIKKSDKYDGDFDCDFRRIVAFNAQFFENGLHT